MGTCSRSLLWALAELPANWNTPEHIDSTSVGTSLGRCASSLLLSLYCGTIMHYRALDIGRVFLMGTWIQLLIFPLAGRLVTRIDPRLLLVVANSGIFLSLWLNAHLTADASMGAIVRPLFVRAIGTGLGSCR